MSNNTRTDESSFNIIEWINILWSRKYILMLIPGSVGILTVLISLQLPNVYKSEALVAPAETNSAGGLASLAQQFGGIASLAGISLPSGEQNKTALAIETVKSRAFINEFINKYHLKAPLIAGIGWDRGDDKVIFDTDDYDPKNDTWIREVSPDMSQIPTDWEAFEAFGDIFHIDQNKETGFITISIEFYSPAESERWLRLLINDINNYMRAKDITVASNSISFLEKQLELTAVAEMRKIFYQLIEEQTKNKMLASAREEYVFVVVDPGVVPEEKVKPKRAIICIIAFLLTFLVCVVYVLAYEEYKKGMNKA